MSKFKNMFIILANLILLCNSGCIPFLCNRNLENFNQTCLRHEYDNSSIKLTVCGPNQYCPSFGPFSDTITSYFKRKSAQNLTCTTFSNKPVFTYLLDGDYCKSTNDCYGYCERGMCVGMDISGDDCVDGTYNCDGKNYCPRNKNSPKCVLRKQEGESCVYDDECLNTAGCLSGTCKSLYTVPAGESLNLPPGFNKYCISGWSNSNKICEDLLINATGKIPCEIDTENGCTYTSSLTQQKVIIPGSCVCDLKTFDSFCRHSTDSYEYVSYINALLNTYHFPCNYYNKGNCYLIPIDVLQNYQNASFSLFGFNISEYEDIYPCIQPKYPVVSPANCTYVPCPKQAVASNSKLLDLCILMVIMMIIIFN